MPLSRERRYPDDAITPVQQRGLQTRSSRQAMGLEPRAINMPKYRRHEVTRDRPELDEGRQKNLRRLAGVGAGLTGVAALFGGNTLAQAGAGLAEGSQQAHMSNLDQYADAMSVFENELEQVSRMNTDLTNREIDQMRQGAISQAGAIAEGRQAQAARGAELADQRADRLHDVRMEHLRQEGRKSLEGKRQEGRQRLQGLRDSSSRSSSRSSSDGKDRDISSVRAQATALLSEAAGARGQLQQLQQSTERTGSQTRPADIRQARQQQRSALQEAAKVMEGLPRRERQKIVNQIIDPLLREGNAIEDSEEQSAFLNEVMELERMFGPLMDTESVEEFRQRGRSSSAQPQSQPEPQSQREPQSQPEPQRQAPEADGGGQQTRTVSPRVADVGNQLIDRLNEGELNEQTLFEEINGMYQAGDLTKQEANNLIVIFAEDLLGLELQDQ